MMGVSVIRFGLKEDIYHGSFEIVKVHCHVLHIGSFIRAFDYDLYAQGRSRGRQGRRRARRGRINVHRGQGGITSFRHLVASRLNARPSSHRIHSIRGRVRSQGRR